MSAYVTPELVNEAFLIVEPTILKVLNKGPAKRNHLSLICLNPTARWNPKLDPKDQVLAVDDMILMSHAFGDTSRWEWDYAKYARAKALLTLRTGKSSGWCQEHPAILLPGDVKYRGSWITESGIITSGSGIQSYGDEWAARIWGETIEMLAYHRHQVIMADENRDYV